MKKYNYIDKYIFIFINIITFTLYLQKGRTTLDVQIFANFGLFARKINARERIWNSKVVKVNARVKNLNLYKYSCFSSFFNNIKDG